MTVFMPCLNEEARVLGALENVFSASERTGTRIEVIVFDDGSTGHTSDVVRAYQAKHPELQISLVMLPENRSLGRKFADGAFLGKGTISAELTGFGFPTELVTRLVAEGAPYKEFVLPATAQPGSKALRLRNFV